MDPEVNDADTLRTLADIVLPLLPPYDFSLYLVLLRATDFQGGKVRVGKRTIGTRLGQSTRSSGSNLQHITAKLNALADAGFIAIGDATREGTMFHVLMPNAVPVVRDALAALTVPATPPDYFTDPTLRLELMERDRWLCRYCGEPVTADTATLDHIVPQARGGPSTPDNLATACLMCNSIKADRAYEDAAADILQAVVRRRATVPVD